MSSLIHQCPELFRCVRADTSKSITATDTRRAAALSALTSTRRSPTSISQFRGFSTRERTTPTCHAPSAFVEEINDNQEDYVPSDDGPGDDGPDGDDPSINDPEPHDDDEDEEGEPLDSLSGQDDAGMTIFNNLSITIDRLGFVNFYCRFIFNYSDIVVPLTRLTQKDAPWNFADTPSIG